MRLMNNPHGIVIVTAAGADIAVHEPALLRPVALTAVYSREQSLSATRSDNGRLSGTSAGRPPVTTREAARYRMRDSGTLSGISGEAEQ